VSPFISFVKNQFQHRDSSGGTTPSRKHPELPLHHDDDALRLPTNDNNNDGGTVLMVLEGLGGGGYGTVVKVQHAVSKQCYAMKVVGKSISSSNASRDRHENQLLSELKYMTELEPSPFVQRCHLAFESPLCVYFVMDLNQGGDLFFHLNERSNNGKELHESQVRIILAELYLALEHLHKHNIIHRDVKIENIMFTSDGHVKLVDFGLAIEITKQVEHMSAGGSLLYMAPELLSKNMGGRFTDWWAYGVLAYELLTGDSPWSSLTDIEKIKREIHASIISPPVNVSPAASRFVMSLLCRDVEKRLGTVADEDIKKCKFFSKLIDWNKMINLDFPPAFAPGQINVKPEDQQSALNRYFDMVDVDNEMRAHPNIITEKCWFLGLEDSSKYLF
jgi:serine/threonine protein kinase